MCEGCGQSTNVQLTMIQTVGGFRALLCFPCANEFNVLLASTKESLNFHITTAKETLLGRVFQGQAVSWGYLVNKELEPIIRQRCEDEIKVAVAAKAVLESMAAGGNDDKQEVPPPPPADDEPAPGPHEDPVPPADEETTENPPTPPAQ